MCCSPGSTACLTCRSGSCERRSSFRGAPRGANPESRGSGFDAKRRPGTTVKYSLYHVLIFRIPAQIIDHETATLFRLGPAGADKLRRASDELGADPPPEKRPRRP